VKANITGVELL